ncbi:copper resistance CopC/CopD family protein [Paenibacillus sp. SGZ-1009]|uniref:copper resistance CopC/CopD family protein n=1 Tax=Paenibacillus campi TaxID=3106031 RepID=UPI002AFF2667|nr:copper resistance protein CopC [Paenibacillus sp. SGZ-1009]
MLLVLLALGFPQQVLAHATVTESSPAQNEVLQQSPKQIMIRFNEDIQRAYYGIQLNRSSGAEVSGINAYIDPKDGTRLLANVPSTLPDDIYTISWKAISGDGHPVEGAIIFQVGNGAGKSLKDATSAALDDSRPLSPLLIALRWLQYAAQAIVLGVLCLPLFLLPLSARGELSWLRERRYTWLALIGASLTVIALAAQLPLRIAWTADIPLSTVGGELGNTFSGTVFGKIWLLQMAAAIIVLVMMIIHQLPSVKPGLQRALGLTALIVLALGLLAKAFDGHAYAAANAGVAIAADYLHLLSALLWSGALLALALFLPRIVRDHTGEERRKLYWGVVRRFSWLAISSVAALLVTGIYGSLIYLPTWNSLFNTGYGLTLLSKMLLFLVMVSFGGMNYAKARSQQGELGKDMIWEVLTGFIVLVLAALLVHLSPYAAPLGNGGTPREVQAQVQQVDGYEISLRVPPSRMGMNTFEVTVKDSQGKPVDVEQIAMQLHHLDMAMAPTDITITAKDGKNGMYETQGMISMNGNWQVDMTVLTSKLESLQTKFVLKVPGS